MAIIGQTISPLSSPDLVLRDLPCAVGVIKGDWVRMSLGVIIKAQADSLVNSEVLGVVEDKSATANICTVRVGGVSKDIFTGLDTTLKYFLSDISPGEMVTTPPTAAGSIVLNLGQAATDKRFLVEKKLRMQRAI